MCVDKKSLFTKHTYCLIVLGEINSGFALTVRLTTGPRRETLGERALKKESNFNFYKEKPFKKSWAQNWKRLQIDMKNPL